MSALCGAVATLLLGTLVARLLYVMAREDAGGAAAAMRPKDRTDAGRGGNKKNASATDASAKAPPAVAAHNQRAAAVATLGGAIAALAFAFSAAGWSASTRLQLENFDALLLLAAGHLLLTFDQRRRRIYALALAFLCGTGCVGSVVFLITAPVFFVVTVRRVLLATQKRKKVRVQALLALLLATLAGAGASLLLRQHLAAADAAGAPSLLAVFASTARLLRTMLGSLLPHVGWVWTVCLAIIPAVLASLIGHRSFHKRSVGTPVVHVFMTAANVLCLANVAFSPWGQSRSGGHLPVMAYLAVAATSGYLFAYWRMLVSPPDQTGKVRRHRRDMDADFWMGVVLMWVPVATVCLVPLANLSEASGRQGEFADRVARSVFAHLGDRTWMASDSLMDNHLRIAAQEDGRRLRVINLSLDKNLDRQQQVCAWIDADPHFAASRARMENAVALGASAFVDVWLREDAAANQALFVVDAPETWQRSGWRAVPEGYGFGGVRNLAQLKGADLLARNRAEWNRLAEILTPATNLPPPLERVRLTLLRQTSRAADDLGVLLEDLGQTNEAAEAYVAASRLDRNNVCALLNLLALPASPVQADARIQMKANLKALLDVMNPHLSPLEFVLLYGDIHQSAMFAQGSRAWASMGQPALAQSLLNQAMALAPASSEIQQLLGSTLAAHGDMAAAARAYRAALDRDATDTTAMLGMASMDLCNGQAADARQWIARARQAGAAENVWAVPYAAQLLAEGQTNEALVYLRQFTEKNAGHLLAWTMEADVLLKQHAQDEVEQQVLPAMSKAIPPHSDSFLIHLVRAHLLMNKKSLDANAIRTELQRALNLRPDLVSIRSDLLRTDMQCGNANDLQQDVDETLRFDADDPLANYLAGTLLIGKGELKRAEEYLRHSLASQPTVEAFNNLAETLRLEGRLTEAEQAARAAIARNPQSCEAWDTLGCTLLDTTNRVAEAGKAIEQALAVHGQDPHIHLHLARVRLAQGRRDDCRQILSQILHGPGVNPDKLPAELRRDVEDLQRRAR